MALRNLATSVARGVGLEGSFLLGGTAALSVGAGFVNPAGPWVVTGVMGIVIGLALSLPRRS